MDMQTAIKTSEYANLLAARAEFDAAVTAEFGKDAADLRYATSVFSPALKSVHSKMVYADREFYSVFSVSA